MACQPVGPPSTCWNGIAYRRLTGAEALASPGKHGSLYVTDIFRRIIVEFSIQGTGASSSLKFERQFRAPFLVDNVHVDVTTQGSLWLGAVGSSHRSFWNGLAALQANASAAHTTAMAAGSATPRPHFHLRPSKDDPPQPAMLSGSLHVDLVSGKVSTKLLQSKQLAAVSWSHGIGSRIFMGSPWDDGVLVCPA